MAEMPPYSLVDRGNLDLLYQDAEDRDSSPSMAVAQSPSEEKVKLKKWLFERRLDYARYFFDHHAKQRMSMFNFFLIFAGFVISGYATLLKKDDYVLASILAIFGAGLTLCFIFMERRNEELVHISEDVLESLEHDLLFCDYDRRVLWPRRRRFWRLDTSEGLVHRPLGIFRRQTADQSGYVRGKNGQQEKLDKCLTGRSVYEHGTWLPIFQAAIFLMFFILGIAPWICRWLGIAP